MQTRKVRKAVIPAAGHGTRFMPITKSVPKEMLVLVDKPAIHYIVEECAESGIEEVAIIVSRGKEAIERYFTPTLNDTQELKALLEKIEKYPASAACVKVFESGVIAFSANKKDGAFNKNYGKSDVFITVLKKATK